jgi:UDP-N-acetylmuramate--alanine ligase
VSDFKGGLRVNKVDLGGRPLHFMGIGGIGMSALAYIVAQRNIPVSGSDVRGSHITDRLESLGAKVFYSQEAENINWLIQQPSLKPFVSVSGSQNQDGTVTLLEESVNHHKSTLPQIICSTAIADANAEYQAALKLGCPIFHRSDVLAALIDEYYSIAVSGTHGKTTTSSLISYLLFKADLDPTIIVGGEVDTWQGNARVGHGQYLVAEADESDGSLIKHSPKVGIITNIELDHPDHYQSLTEVIEIFQTFAHQCETVIGCLDDEVIAQNISVDISYSLKEDSNADYVARHVNYHAQGSIASVWEKGQLLGTLNLQLLGHHNLSNALAAIAVGRQIGLEFAVIADALASFSGTKRRFELKGEINQIKFIDDYAHHPREVEVTLAAAKLQVRDGMHQRVVAIFQPHRYSRTAIFLQEFATAFSDADVVVITDIYSAGETNTQNISGQQLADLIALKHPQVYYQPNLDSLPQFLQQQILQPQDLVMFLGAGNLNQYIAPTLELLVVSSKL